ncbi:hypothetical protein B9S53_20430 [Arthrospira sp. O9.13F]|nr:hypothetical protein B9S53_20430 [Arthrospira sp. O9.13F]
MIGFYHESDLMSMSSGKFGMVWGLTVYSLLSCESFGVLYLIVLRCKANLGLNSCSTTFGSVAKRNFLNYAKRSGARTTRSWRMG